MRSEILTYCKSALLRAIAAMVAVSALTACDSAIYDDEGDCDIHYRLQFRFDYNLMWADAFSHHVHSVAVYAFHPDGTFAWQRRESGLHLAADGYTMSLDGVEPGQYRLIAWCGMDNSFLGTEPESFTLPELVPGESDERELQCRMERIREADGSASSRSDLWPLFHGTVADVEIIDPNSLEADGQTVVYTCNLMKDTNRVRVILQQLSGDDLDVNNFTFRITSDNGHMAHDNEVLDDETITYHPWNTESGVAGVGQPGLAAPGRAGEPGFTPVRVAIADLTVARLIYGRPMTLTVTNTQQETVASIPLVDYAVLVKGNYDEPMDEQEYLDREDTYTLTFFLDRDQKWAGVSLYINSWRVVLKDFDINS